ncbi:DUF4276 family protein [Candidatus Sumerlaeota bacterium]|nr:DUF4276 family protein [Candidatus Sumerlaeota bacterium]
MRESRDESKSYVLLLVDSESEVAANSNSWDHVQKQDGWPKPGYAGEDQLHLMAQAMESWLLGDLDNLAAFFESKLHLNEQRHFRRECIKLDSPLEKVPKNMILDWLRKATEAEGRTPYHKTAHGFHILQYLDPEKVRAQLPHADRFCAALIKISQFRFPKTSTS